MAKTKISEFSSTPGNNTDIDGINIAEGCAPSGINDAIRELMSQLKDFQTGSAGDSFNGPIGSTTPAAGAFTTLSASSTVSGTGFSTYLASPPAIGGTTRAAGNFTTLNLTNALTTANGGTGLTSFTANGVVYASSTSALTTGSALTFDGTNLGIGTSSPSVPLTVKARAADNVGVRVLTSSNNSALLQFTDDPVTAARGTLTATSTYFSVDSNGGYLSLATGGTERARIDSSGNLLVGATSGTVKLVVNSTDAILIPKGTSAQQPGTPLTGMIRYNTSTNSFEGYSGSSPAWSALGGGAATPAGAVMSFAMSTAPSGWLKANGAAVSRTTYSALFAAIGTTFGSGDGSTTFNLPDMRGYFARGWVDDGSVDSGRAFGSTQQDQFQGHWHGGVINTSGSAVPYTGSGAFGDTLKTGDPVTGNNGTVRFGNETRPVNVALLACIKY